MGASIFSKNVAYRLVLYLSVIRVQIFHVPSICLLVVMPRQYTNRATTTTRKHAKGPGQRY